MQSISRIYHKIYKTEDELVMHIAGQCGGLAKQQYKIRHDAVGRRVHWELGKKYEIECSEKWYQHSPKKVSLSANGHVEILWDDEINGKVRHN